MTTHVFMADDEPDAQEFFYQNFRREIRKGVYSLDVALLGDDETEKNLYASGAEQCLTKLLELGTLTEERARLTETPG